MIKPAAGVFMHVPILNVLEVLDDVVMIGQAGQKLM